MTLFPQTTRTPDELLTSALAVIDDGLRAGAKLMLPLFSGGDDSHCACHVASRHPAFAGEVHHIDTGIGAAATRRHVDAVCREHGWRLRVWRSSYSYERFVRERGFPGPGRHQWIYNRLKDRCVRQMVRPERRALITGCRSDESTRRMGHVRPVQVGEPSKKIARVREQNRVWVAPCHDWTAQEQAVYMDEHDLPRNPIRPVLGLSGECFCGAFASPGELERVRAHAPDVAEEIDRLAGIALECGTHAAWGTRPPSDKGLVAVRSGPLCSSCDLRAKAAGLLFKDAV